MSGARICAAEGCVAPLSSGNRSGLCRSHRMKAMNADPEFAERHRERMKALNADPEFADRHRERMKALNADPEFNPLVLLTDAERADYDTLKRAGYGRDEAFSAIGRGDLCAGDAA